MLTNLELVLWGSSGEYDFILAEDYSRRRIVKKIDEIKG
jgi:hypothetical protein